jgi:hypothetical protein
MRHLHLPFFCALSITFAVSLHAEVLYEWTFDDPSGTSLSHVSSSGTEATSWSGDFDETQTNGAGQLLVGRSPDGIANAYVAVSKKIAHGEQPLWVLVELGGWEFKGKSASETMRLGLAHLSHETRPHVLAQILLERTDSNTVTVGAESFGEGAKSMVPLPIFASEEKAVTLVLKVDPSANQLVLYYRQGVGDFLYLGEGSTSPERTMSFLRLGFSGYFNAADEHLTIDRIAYFDHDPMGVAE